MPYLLLLAFMVPRTTCIAMTKLNSDSFSKYGLTGSLLYTLETSLFSLPVFWIANGCTLGINGTVLLYGAMYGVCSFACLILAVFMYNYGSITLVNFISSTVTLIASSFFGAILLGEEITPELLLRVFLMLLCVLAVFLGAKKDEPVKKEKRGVSLLSFLLPTLYALFGLGATFLIKFYTNTPGATDTNSLFFTVNVFSLIYSLPFIYFASKKAGMQMKEVAGLCIDKRSAFTLISTAFGGIQAIITALLIEQMDVALYTPVVSALGFVCMAIASPIVREKLDRYKLTATLIAIASLFLPTLIFAG